MIAPIFRAANLSQAWLDAVAHVRVHGATFQLVVQIEDMTAEDPMIRRRVDAFLDQAQLPSVATVRNTIFPVTDAKFARDEVATLVKRYRATYDQTRKFAGNNGGTYFGRMVAAKPWPQGGTYDQLTYTIAKLCETGTNATRTEVDLSDLNDLDHSVSIGIYETGRDARKTMGFPCMSHLAFQRDGDALHAIGFYRNQNMVTKAYGNYLGLAQLTKFIARHTGLRASMLTVIAGRADIHAHRRLLDTCVLNETERTS